MSFFEETSLHQKRNPLGKTGLNISRVSCDLSKLWSKAGSEELRQLLTACLQSGVNCFDMGFPLEYWSHQQQNPSGRHSLQVELLGQDFTAALAPSSSSPVPSPSNSFHLENKEDLFVLFRLPALFGGNTIDLSIAKELEQAIGSVPWPPRVQLGVALDFMDQPHFCSSPNPPFSQHDETPIWRQISQNNEKWSSIIGGLKKILWPTVGAFGIGSFFTQDFLPVIHWQSVDFIIAHQHFGWLDHPASLAVETFCGRHSIGIFNDDYCYGGILQNKWTTESIPEEQADIFVASEDAALIQKAALLAEEYETDLESLAFFHAAGSSIPTSTITPIESVKDLELRITQSQTHLPARPLSIIGRPLSGFSADSFVP